MLKFVLNMPFQEKTKNKIKDLTRDFFDNKIFKLDIDPEIIQKAYPWHSVFFTPEAAIAALKERSLVTSVGMKFVPQLSKIVAEDRYKDVHLNYAFHCQLDKGSVTKIDNICRELRREIGDKTRTPNHDNEMKEIEESKNGELTDIRIICDLYVGDHKDGQLFYEIKSPKPNLDQTSEAKKKILLFRQVSTDHLGFFALHYNPYITKEKYSWSFCKSLMDLDKQVLIGEEMWNLIGDNNTYDEMLELLHEISKEKWKEFENRGKIKKLTDF